MYNRPIKSLEEDFAALGLVEADDSGSEMDPRKKGLKKVPMNSAQKRAMQKQAAQDNMEDFDFDGEPLEELRLKKIKKLRGVKAMKAHRQAHKWYLGHKSQVRKKARTVKAKRRRLKLSKMPKARRGYRRVGLVAGTSLGNMGGAITNLNGNTNLGGLQEVFVNLTRWASSIRDGYTPCLRVTSARS